MNNLEKLEDLAEQKGVELVPYSFESPKIKGLYCDNTIAISTSIKTSTEKACILAEELGHYETTTGDITDQSNTTNRKQEARARLWAYTHIITLLDIARAYKRGCHTLYEMAEHLDVTEEFLQDALQAYKAKYGTGIKTKDCYISFEPSFAVYESFPQAEEVD